MLENCNSAREDWGVINHTIDGWLHERQDMLVRYCALSDAESFDEQNKVLCKRVRQLCQMMMDYVSAGHFKVYDALLQESRDCDDREALAQASQLYAVIEKTTDAVLDFNDKYQETDDLSSLINDLSVLGEQLATRFEAEDRMISILDKVHEDPVA